MTEAQRRDSARLQSEWEEAQRTPKLAAMRATRQKLPAYGSRTEVTRTRTLTPTLTPNPNPNPNQPYKPQP